MVRPDTKIIIRKLRDHLGNAQWNTEIASEGSRTVSNIRISIDLRRDSPLSLVVHELLHVYMSLYLHIGSLLDDSLEESAILAWERDLINYLQAPQREKKLESWNQAIRRKLTT